MPACGVFVVGIVLVFLEVLCRLFWLSARLAASAVVGFVGAVSVVGMAAPGAE